jgi:hypothetical protein
VSDHFFDAEADVFDKVSALIETWTGFKSYYQQNSTNHAIQRFDWTPVGGVASQPLNPGRAHAANRPLWDIEFRCDIACRGKTSGEAWRMAQIVLTAIRQTHAANAKLESWRPTETSDQAATLKTVVFLTVVWKLPLMELDLTNEVTRVTFIDAHFDTSTPPYGVDDDTLIAPLG